MKFYIKYNEETKSWQLMIEESMIFEAGSFEECQEHLKKLVEEGHRGVI